MGLCGCAQRSLVAGPGDTLPCVAPASRRATGARASAATTRVLGSPGELD